MSDSAMNLFWVVLFRTAQTVLDAAPTLLCGLFVAGLMRGMIGPEPLRQWFSADDRIGPVRAWITGLLLPVCSFGVLPIAWELKRAGVPRASLVVLMATAASFRLPLEPIVLVLGVDALMDMGRTAINVTGNCLASVVVARWEGRF